MDEATRVAIAVLETNAKNFSVNLTRLENKVDAGFSEIKADMKNGFQRSDARMDKIGSKIDSVKDSLASAKIWALVLCISLLACMAKGFLWLAEKISIP